MKKTRPTALIAKPNLKQGAGGSLVQVVLNADLRNGPDGLLELGKRKGVDWNRLNPGQYVAFVNTKMNRFMLLGLSPSRRGVVVVYYKSYAGRIDRQEMETLPLAFGGQNTMSTPKQLGEGLDQSLAFKRARRIQPIPPTRVGGK